MYFKRKNITESNSERIERNIRLLSLKRHTSLDFKYVSTYINEPNKFFLGFENEKRIDLLRISSPFEKLLPKIIVTFKKENFKEYKLRLKLISMILFVFLTIALILNLYYSIKSGKLESNFLLILILNLTFYVLAFVEYKLVNRKIRKVIKWNE